METAAAFAPENNPGVTLCMGCMAPATADHVCPLCGWNRHATAASVLHLPPGTRLQNYVLGRVLGQGGFGITYLGWDLQLQRKVAVKEYFPQAIASRVPHGATVTATSMDARDGFAYGLDRFLAEGRTLARFADHPCIVSVLSLFEANNTGYLVMGYLEGVTLSQALQDAGGKLAYAAAREIMMRVMDGLREMHSQGMLHRDVSPDNIYLTRQGPVKLLDFGAARMAVRERSQDLSVMVKEGYAPPEQYIRTGKQGAWTDVYAAAATFYRVITGFKPPTALERQVEETLVKPSAYCADLPARAEAAILKGMSLRPDMRYQTVEQFQQDLPLPAPPRGPETPDGRKGSAAGSGTGAGASDRKFGLAIVTVAAVAVLGLSGWLGVKLLHSYYESQGESNYRAGYYQSARGDFEKAGDNDKALTYLGRIYANGQEVLQDFTRARDFFDRAAQQGNSDAMDNLGLLYENGFGVEQNPTTAADWYRKAAAAGNADAMGRIGVLAHDGRGVPKDLNQAREWYEKGSAHGSSRATTNLGLLYARADGVNRDFDRARTLYQNAIDAGSPGAMTEMGILYDNGDGVTKDPAQARSWYEKGAAAGDPYAMVYLGDIYGSGRGVGRDPKQSREWYDKASAAVIPYAVDLNVNERRIIAGRALGLLRIGDLYRFPDAGAADNTEAEKWYRKSADAGNSFALFRLGQIYDTPGGYDTARQWYEKAAAAGDAGAMNNLGILYYFGRGAAQSYDKAREWYEKAAGNGSDVAMKNLGYLYKNGTGVPVNLTRAAEWWEKSANAGNTDAMVALAEQLLDEESQPFNFLWFDKDALLKDLRKAREWLQKASDSGNQQAAALLPKADAAIGRVEKR